MTTTAPQAAATSQVFRGRGQLFIRCVECSSRGTCHARTAWVNKVEYLPNCPWCDAQMNLPVQPLPDGLAYPKWA